MYRIKNISLEPVLRQYKIQSLNDLTDDQLTELCNNNKNLNVQMQFYTIKDEKKRGKRRGGFDRYKTIDYMKLANTFSDYMGKEYWESRHQQIADERDLIGEISEHKRGDDTFKAMANIGFGFYNLKPGEEQIIDVTGRWIKDYLAKTRPSLWPKITVTKIEDGITTLANPEARREVLDNLEMKEVIVLAKGLGINSFQKTRVAIIGEIIEAERASRVAKTEVGPKPISEEKEDE